MVSKIRVLDELTINKIAAGEVIENPASVVKELVENSLDAGSTDIHIEISCGGRQLIRIVDNGCGMTKDDALLCLERYATSKIREVDDLSSLATMGFRGEALPSIASISKVTILTATEAGKDGTLVIAEGGRILKCCEAARAPGTTLEVKALFFNVPVRRKFQRSPAHDTAAVHKCVIMLSLAYPAVDFTLVADQKLLLQAPKATATESVDQILQRSAAVLGREYLNESTSIQVVADGYQVLGLIGLPMNHRPNRSGQYLFINRRAVTSPLIASAIRDGYGTALPNQRFPTFVLHLQLPGDHVDVNVHPQKREVRLRQEQQLREVLRKAVSGALQGESDVAVSTPWPPTHQPWESLPTPASRPQYTQSQDLPWDNLPRFSHASEAPAPLIMRECPPEPPFQFTSTATTPRVLTSLPGYLILDPSTCHGLGKGEQGLWIVDQRAAHCRLLYERLTHASAKTVVETQSLLLPLTLHLAPPDHTILLDALPELQRLGLEIDAFGPTTLRVQAIPVEFDGANITELLREMADELRSFQSQTLMEKERAKRIVQRASRAALSRRSQLSRVEGDRLVEALLRCESAYLCPMGKPTFVCLGQEALTKLFQR